MDMGHKDGDPDKTQEEYDTDNHADQENSNNDEYDKWEGTFFFLYFLFFYNLYRITFS